MSHAHHSPCLCFDASSLVCPLQNPHRHGNHPHFRLHQAPSAENEESWGKRLDDKDQCTAQEKTIVHIFREIVENFIAVRFRSKNRK